MTSAPITYIPAFVTEPDALFARLWEGLAWQRRGNTPRREYYCNDVDAPYRYGRGDGEREYLPQPWHEDILAIREALEALAGARFEVCFLNGYEDASDHLGWHADASPEMDPGRPIGIVSLGAEREIWFGRKPAAGDKSPTDIERLKLGNGSLCLMAAGMQQTHLHRIPKAGFVCGPRISLTFRGYRAVGEGA